MRLVGVELCCSDVARSREFYGGTLGLAVAEDQSAHVMFKGGGAFLCLRAREAEVSSAMHKAILSFEVADLAAVVDRIGRERFTKTNFDSTTCWAALNDPDGNVILLVHMRS